MIRALVTLVAWATLGRAAGECPAGCQCAVGEQLELACQWGDEQLTLAAAPRRYVSLACHGGELRCERLPRLHTLPGLGGARDAALPSLGVSECRLAGGGAGCAARALGAAAVGALRLAAPLAAAAAALLPPPAGLRSLTLDAGADPAAALAAPADLADLTRALPDLPQLRRLTVRNARLLLEPDAFRDAPPLEWLELSLDGIRRLPAGAFRGLNALRDLGLWGNEIVELGAGALEGLDSLERLDISRNVLRRVTDGSLSSTPRLRVLRSRGNPLEEVSSGALAGAAALERLEVTECGAALQLGARALAALAALREASVRRCGLRALPPDLLAGSRALTNLSLAGNRLQTLPPPLLRDQRALRGLDLSDNRITELSPEFFSSLHLLEELNLDRNHIEYLPEMVFSGLSGVRSISVRENHLRHIADSAFAGAGGLRRLALDRNRLTLRAPPPPPPPAPALPTDSYFDLEAAPRSPFNTLMALRELRLSNNHISDVFYDWRILMLHLELLDLSSNDFVNLTDIDLNFLSDNITVDLRNNSITTIRFIEFNNNSTRSSRILLEDNPFLCDCFLFELQQRIQNERRQGVERLVVGEAACAAPAALAGARLAAVPPPALLCALPAPALPAACAGTLRPAATGSTLHLNCTKHVSLASLPSPDIFGASATELTLTDSPPSHAIDKLPPHVHVLRLAGLGLTTTPLEHAPPSLVELDLTDNRLRRAPVALLAASPSLGVRLAGNPLECECAAAGEVAQLQRLEARVLDYGEVRCGGGGRLAAVDGARLCAGARAAAVGGALALLGLLAAVGAALAYRYSHELKVLAYARGWWARPARDEDGSGPWDYDVFVSFSHGDEKFVTEELVPALERGPRALRVCVHYRDWAPGELITTQIARSVERSRRTLVVVSQHFLRSAWGRLEFRAAHVAALRSRRARVLAVLLEDVPPADPALDPELRAYLATNTYVRRDDPWFWDKLRYALPPPLPPAPSPPPDKPGPLDVRLPPA